LGVVFLTTLAAGYLGVLAMCRMDQVAWKFVRLVTILALAALSLAVAGYMGLSGGAIGRYAAGAAAFVSGAGLCSFLAMGLAPVTAHYGRSVRLLSGLGGLLALTAAGLWSADQQIWRLQAPILSADAAVAALSAFLLGSVSLAMLLGHAYLTHTAMPIQPLRRLAVLFAAAMTLRLLAALIAGAYAWSLLRRGALSAEQVRQEQLVLGLRYIVGLLIPAIFCYMVYRTVRLRATQSATGILYFGLVLIYLGELAAIQLTRELGVPF
jgi:hypothetical protein